ncbi:hypothetical protein SARC_05915 [Sphaeroforma arctica JP610]|uniref:Immediate early response 3-interacting protein 1 n=1 Tax=Sphaeroforma arctica JP610 TaxID=667725 RepID=A0A0L0FY63_9EUKA|nr:hypothetical protein SARC_05915 [Sphaeroforma arctica JP610]KNC81767.1 hypothetical protein SARC_05915 [Sphaeroforma arctica JP610]|eukprot:XP_014155669.1 hypothetical protein SARC_05915 [Sphaeroforma arctica JP610]
MTLDGLGYQQAQQSGFDPNDQGAAKDKMAALIYAVRTLTRIPLIGMNLVAIIFKVILG